MILIADGGSTKTDWRLVQDSEHITAAKCGGLNPMHLSDDEIKAELETLPFSPAGNNIQEIFFYGAGIVGDKAEQRLKLLFRDHFGDKCIVSIGSDILGAARALFKEKNGVVCILGTGSNSCLYENGEIIDKIPPLGYILGDEGSGTDIGKRFVNALFKKALPEDLQMQIMASEKLDMQEVIEKVYRSEMPAKYLASLTQIVIKYVHHEAIAEIVEAAFDSFIERNVSKYANYKDYEVGFVGSLALHFKPNLEKVLKMKKVKLGDILPAPIDELALYHI